MPWWTWILSGLVLLALEIVTPGGFFVVFFGLAAIVVGVAVGAGFAGPVWLQWTAFSVIAVLSLLLFRDRLVRLMRARTAPTAVDRLEGETVIPLEDLSPGAFGKAELRGAAWTVRNADVAPLVRGQRCRVTGIEGLTLSIRAE